MRDYLSLVVVTAASPLLLAAPAGAQNTDAGEETLEQVVVTGTRVADRSALETAVPVDVVSSDALQNIGVTEVAQALSVALPSLNFPRPGLSDGTDTVRPATLRGLAPDQVLVLANGKRRHTAALVNVNNTIGRGSAAVDLNALPTGIVEAVEVLRDGASAQYGSDAIAGVINLRLRDARDGGDITATYGWRDSSYTANTVPAVNLASPAVPVANPTWSVPTRVTRDVSDGETLTVSAWKGLALGEAGFLTVAAEYRDQERTERDGYDTRQQYALSGGQLDSREATFNRFSGWSGEPELEQTTFFANAGYDFEGGATLYAWAGYQERESLSAGFYRPANDGNGNGRNVVEIYPDGFLPLISPDVTDLSGAVGARWELGQWNMDSSFVYGRNKMEFTIENTLNRSLGTASPTVFDAGGFEYDQLVYNLSGVRTVDVSWLNSALNVAIGLEARTERYQIFAGEPDSYRNGGVLLANGSPAQSGSQVFPGFRPSDVTDEDRDAIGAYVDLEANVTEKFLASVAVRGEHYSDFGDNVSGKLAGRYDFNDHFALRASVQNGFRAPSLQQQFFRSTATNFINVPGRGNVPFDIVTFPATDPVAAALGAKPLEAEESFNYSIGAVLRFDNLNITVDAYRIDIDDRIVLSENLISPEVRNYLATQGFPAIGGGRFFINGVDTETEGVDLVVSYLLSTGIGRFDLALTANFTSTDVTRVPQTEPLAALSPPPVLFGRQNTLTLEDGQPEDKFGASVNWSLDRLGATLRVTRYGDALAPDPNPVNDFTLSAKTVVDLEGRFSFNDHIRVAVGADNLLDEYPDEFRGNLNTTGNLPFSNLAPFGRGGRFIYGRMTYSF